MSSKVKVVVDPRIPGDRLILEGIDVSLEPLFGVTDVAKVFFGRSPHWIRWLEEKHAFVINGDPNCSHTKHVRELRPVPVLDEDGEKILDAFGKKVTEEKMIWVDVGDFTPKTGRCKKCKGQKVGGRRTESGARIYSLADVELVAHALAQNRNIDGIQLQLALSVVEISARIWGYLDIPKPVEDEEDPESIEEPEEMNND